MYSYYKGYFIFDWANGFKIIYNEKPKFFFTKKEARKFIDKIKK